MATREDAEQMATLMWRLGTIDDGEERDEILDDLAGLLSRLTSQPAPTES